MFAESMVTFISSPSNTNCSSTINVGLFYAPKSEYYQCMN